MAAQSGLLLSHQVHSTHTQSILTAGSSEEMSDEVRWAMQMKRELEESEKRKSISLEEKNKKQKTESLKEEYFYMSEKRFILMSSP